MRVARGGGDRPAEPGTFPGAPGLPGEVGRPCPTGTRGLRRAAPPTLRVPRHRARRPSSPRQGWPTWAAGGTRLYCQAGPQGPSWLGAGWGGRGGAGDSRDCPGRPRWRLVRSAHVAQRPGTAVLLTRPRLQLLPVTGSNLPRAHCFCVYKAFLYSLLFTPLLSSPPPWPPSLGKPLPALQTHSSLNSEPAPPPASSPLGLTSPLDK